MNLIDKANYVDLQKNIDKLKKEIEKNVNEKTSLEENNKQLKKDNNHLQIVIKKYKKILNNWNLRSFNHLSLPQKLFQEGNHNEMKNLEAIEKIKSQKSLHSFIINTNEKSSEIKMKKNNQVSEIIKYTKLYKLLDILSKITNFPEFLSEIVMYRSLEI